MGNYRQHLGFAGALGIGYGGAAAALGGVPWLYASVATFLATMSGLLPDIDHPIGVEMKGITGVLGVVVALAVWNREAASAQPYPFELQLWGVIAAFISVRYGLRSVLAKLMVHRGISHSLPACAAWGAATYLYYPSATPLVRALMASAVMVGFLSHLVLDEMFSVDLTGHRLKTSFGTALKFWAPSPLATVGIYLLLLWLASGVIDRWPSGSIFSETIEAPALPPLPPWLRASTIRDYLPAAARRVIPGPVGDDEPAPPSRDERPPRRAGRDDGSLLR